MSDDLIKRLRDTPFKEGLAEAITDEAADALAEARATIARLEEAFQTAADLSLYAHRRGMMFTVEALDKHFPGMLSDAARKIITEAVEAEAAIARAALSPREGEGT